MTCTYRLGDRFFIGSFDVIVCLRVIIMRLRIVFFGVI